MSFQDIMALRKAGDLEAATKAAKEFYRHNPQDVWAHRALGWIIYDHSKRGVQNGDHRLVIQCLLKLPSLQLGEDDRLLWDAFLKWVIAPYAHKLSKAGDMSAKLYTLFLAIRTLPIKSEDESYYFLLRSFYYSGKSDLAKNRYAFYLDFFDWWDLSTYLREEDYEKTVVGEMKYPSLAEQIYQLCGKILISKKLYYLYNEAPLAETANFIDTGDPNYQHKRKIAISLLPELRKLEEKHKDNVWLQYYVAKIQLLYRTEPIEKVRATIARFVLKKQKDFWAWELLGDAYEDEPLMRLACYCKGLLCPANNVMTCQLRKQLIPLLVENDLLDAARCEIENIRKIRASQKWGIDKEVEELAKQRWYQEAAILKDNKAIYQQFTRVAETLVAEELDKVRAVIYYLNKEKSIASFITEDGLSGFFNYRAISGRVDIGGLYVLYYDEQKDNGYYSVKTVKLLAEEDIPSLSTTVQGKVRIGNGGKFAFVNDIYIPEKLLINVDIENNEFAEVKAIRSWDRSKDKLSWMALTIKRIKVINI